VTTAPHLRRLLALAAAAVAVVALAACGDDADQADPPAGPDTTEAVTDPDDELPEAAAAMVERIRGAARDGDLGQLAELAFEVDGEFTASFGEELTTPEEVVAHWRDLEADEPGAVTEPLLALLDGPGWHLEASADRDDLTGDLYVTPAFMHDPTDEHRDRLVDALGPDYVDASLADGQYLGWRAGITGDGAWRFFVSGD
jgi:hypothetical protein